MVNQQVARELLTSEGARVELADNGQSCVSMLERNPRAFDAVLMDLQMPVMDGYSATERIRQWEAAQQRPRTAILALTADAFEEDRLRCMAVGMDDFLVKPITLPILSRALAKWLPVPDTPLR